MILTPTRCPKCGDQLSTPIRSRRDGQVVQTCRNADCLHTEWTSVPSEGSPAPAFVMPQSLPLSEPQPAPAKTPAKKPSAFERFEEAQLHGDVRKTIAKARRDASAAAAGDPKIKQLGRNA